MQRFLTFFYVRLSTDWPRRTHTPRLRSPDYTAPPVYTANELARLEARIYLFSLISHRFLYLYPTGYGHSRLITHTIVYRLAQKTGNEALLRSMKSAN